MRSSPARRWQGEDGFTLLELMVVVLVIAVLLAVAIPTFRGAQARASDRATQSDLRNALTAAKVIAVDDGGLLTNVTDASLAGMEGAMAFAPVGTTAAVGVEQAATPADAVYLYKATSTGTYFGIATNRSGAIGFCSFDTAADAAAVAIDAALTGCEDPRW